MAVVTFDYVRDLRVSSYIPVTDVSTRETEQRFLDLVESISYRKSLFSFQGTAIGWSALEEMKALVATDGQMPQDSLRSIVILTEGDTEETETQPQFDQRMAEYSILAQASPVPSCLFSVNPNPQTTAEQSFNKVLDIMQGKYSDPNFCLGDGKG